MNPLVPGSSPGGPTTSVKLFVALFAALVLGFYFLPDQAGRNLLLYATALSAHLFLLDRSAWKSAYGHTAGWLVAALILLPALSLTWSSNTPEGEGKDILIAAYCLVFVYLGVGRAIASNAALAGALVNLMLAAGNLVAIAAIGVWVWWQPAEGANRLEGILGIDNPVHASVLLLASTLPVARDLVEGRRSLLWAGSLLAPLSFVILAGARMAAAAYVVVVLFTALAHHPRVATAVGIATVALGSLTALLLGSETAADIWLSRGLSFRDEIWQQVWSAYVGCNVVLGCGIGTPLDLDVGGIPGSRTHSIFVAALYYEGALGLLAFCVSLGWLVWSGLRGSPAPGADVRGWALMLAYVALANATSGDHVLVRASLFWPAFWIPVMLLAAMLGRETRQRASI